MLPLLHLILALLLAPLLPGLINKVKAFFAGRQGPPLLQLYYDLAKLLRKGAVYSRTATWVFRAGPMVGLAAVLCALGLAPLGRAGALLPFECDLLLFACLLGLMRFFTVLAALDTGSAFEGMGASREAQFSALAEPVLLLALTTLALIGGHLSLGGAYARLSLSDWHSSGAALGLLAGCLFVILLAENARIPVDDPNTHLELTMIHEVMVLDHSGPDFAFILYSSALKLWIFSALMVGILLPIHTGSPWLDAAIFLAGMAAAALAVGIVESSMARLRLLRVPQLLVGAGVLAALALLLVLRASNMNISSAASSLDPMAPTRGALRQTTLCPSVPLCLCPFQLPPVR